MNVSTSYTKNRLLPFAWWVVKCLTLHAVMLPNIEKTIVFHRGNHVFEPLIFVPHVLANQILKVTTHKLSTMLQRFHTIIVPHVLAHQILKVITHKIPNLARWYVFTPAQKSITPNKNRCNASWTYSLIVFGKAKGSTCLLAFNGINCNESSIR